MVDTKGLKLTVLTCTGDRPEAFVLSERWMDMQTVRPDRWIVVDDGTEPTKCKRGQEVIRAAPMIGHSLARNLRLGLEYIRDTPLSKNEVIAFWEDDDFYQRWWLDRCMTEFQVEDASGDGGLPAMVGEAVALYYNVKHRRYFRHANFFHASLAMTAIRREMIGYMLGGWPLNPDPGATDPANSETMVDWRLWDQQGEHIRCNKRIWRHDSQGLPGVVGIKGMPGRAGMAGGHRPDQMENYIDDHDLKALRSVMGPFAEIYAKYHQTETPHG